MAKTNAYVVGVGLQKGSCRLIHSEAASSQLRKGVRAHNGRQVWGAGQIELDDVVHHLDDLGTKEQKERRTRVAAGGVAGIASAHTASRHVRIHSQL